MNLLDTIGLFGTVVLAAPIGLLGVEFLLGDRPIVGAGFLVIAVALVAGGYFRPSLKGIVADTVADVAVKAPDDGDEGDADRVGEDEDGETYKH
ncbi:hypothetical protein KM295_13855 [Natronomonas sp. F2-12]|jgi:hypothetical protein|uniref:Uncharacterized protein n=1 Tax=Natronomonas aquatica TaxID=2841590 RepID=A0A9R1CSI7_9EURY|nr:hypothetical protein [Natronomonas aquatica]MCQ4334538.1 hypothetical protein [Natronomonas aquatica]